jgi:acyl-CoA dehydrogenase
MTEIFMPDDIATRIDAWLARNPNPAIDPFPGMAEAGLFEPAGSYAAIAATKAALVERTGLLGVGGAWGGRQMVGRWFIDQFGNAQQRAAWRGKAASVAISEPKVGAHPKHLRTRAEPVEGRFRISGEKAWVSNGPSADVIVVFAITAEQDGRKRYSAFLMPHDTPGLSMQDMPGFHALRPSQHCMLTLDGCVMPASALLGEADTAYERMAMPFRDVEDAVGTVGTRGAFHFLLPRLTTGENEAALSRGALVALSAVYAAAAAWLVDELDAGRFVDGSAVLVGLRVLATEMLQRMRTHIATHGPAGDAAVDTMLADIDATLSIARGPRIARQARLGLITETSTRGDGQTT